MLQKQQHVLLCKFKYLDIQIKNSNCQNACTMEYMCNVYKLRIVTSIKNEM